MKLGGTIPAWLCDEAEMLTIRVLERNTRQFVAGEIFNFTMLNLIVVKPPRPNFERFRPSCNAQRNLTDISRTNSRGWDMFPIKESKFRARAAKRICVEKVISGNVILVNCLFHQAHPEKAGVEVEVGPDIRGHSGNVMQAI